jgi:tetratricopeptide (TPR) repeat protein
MFRNRIALRSIASYRKPGVRRRVILPAVAALLLPAACFLVAGRSLVRQTIARESGPATQAGPGRSPSVTEHLPARITVDYPEQGTIFPPEITPPTFLWRDVAPDAKVWQIDISFSDGWPGVRVAAQGERLQVGKIDPSCIAETNELPRLTPRQAAARTWIPDIRLWETIKEHSRTGSATVSISGLRGPGTQPVVSRGSVTIRTSCDPVGAPIFYRDVPLMPTETEKGNIKPLAPYAVRLIKWRLRDVGVSNSRVLMENVPMCANCHSFSLDGKTLGMDLDGLQNNKGMYTLTPVARETTIRNENVIQWSSARGRLKGNIRVGFMSQVSPHGDYVVTTINPDGEGESSTGSSKDPPSNYYVANFKDYRFLQVFYPTRGILAWYSRKTGILEPLPGADDPRFVQMGAVWSPDGKYLVFARAEATDPNPEDAPPARYAGDPGERQIRYDLFRIPFNHGEGGRATPLEGASRNGMSNTFPKVSPDGRWIVFVRCRNGQLMRPDSQLYIVPATGGTARRMRCNTKLMNSWHSFSPNSRWLVFASKSRSPYTQMYLTHIDPDGNDSPAVLIENTTAANRAVNIPEFVNIAPDGLREIGGPAIEYYRLVDSAMYFRRNGRYEDSVAEWRKVLEVSPNDAFAHSNLGTLLLLTGHPQEAASNLRRAKEIRLDETISQLRKVLEFESGQAATYYRLGVALKERGEGEEAVREWGKAVETDPGCAEAHDAMGREFYAQGKVDEALAQWRAVIRLQPKNVEVLRRAAWTLATSPRATNRDGKEALTFALRAAQLSDGSNPAILDVLAAAYAENGQFSKALQTAGTALNLALQQRRRTQAEALQERIALYRAEKPFREKHPGTGTYP